MVDVAMMYNGFSNIIYTIIVGLFGFILISVAEWATYKKIRFLKPISWIGSIPVLTYALIKAWNQNPQFYLPTIVSTLAWGFFAFFLLLFIYSAYVEIPLKLTYINSSHPLEVVTNGTYSLCRHPATFWFGGWLIFAILASKSVALAIAAPFWVVAYILCIVLEEKLSCLSSFSNEYKMYQKTTPMFIPTPKSILSFLREVRYHFRTSTRNL